MHAPRPVFSFPAAATLPAAAAATLRKPLRLRAAFVAFAGAVLVSASMLSPGTGSLLRPAQAAPSAPAVAKAPVDDMREEVERLVLHISEQWKTPIAATQRIVEAAFQQAQVQNVSPTLILAIVAQESSFRNQARSSYGAQGLMQVSARHHPEKLKGLGSDALYRTETNIRVGTQVLVEYLQLKNGRLDAALRKYSGNATAYPHKIRTFWSQLEQVRRTDSLDGTRLARAN